MSRKLQVLPRDFNARFFGSEDYHPLGSARDLGLYHSSFTIMTWLKLDRVMYSPQGESLIQALVGEDLYLEDNQHLHLFLQDRQLHFGFDPNNETISKTKFELKRWYHVAVVYDKQAQAQTMYVDGAMDAFGSLKPALQGNGNSLLYLSRFKYGHSLHGKIAEFKIIHHAVNQGDVQKCMHDALRGGHCDQCSQVDPTWHKLNNIKDGELMTRKDELLNEQAQVLANNCRRFEGGDFYKLGSPRQLGINACSFTITALLFGFQEADTVGETVLQEGCWYHVAFVYDRYARRQAIYLNGVEDGRSEGRDLGDNFGDAVLNIARFAHGRCLNGKIAELHIWYHAFRVETIQTLMKTDICGYSQVTPEWNASFNAFDGELPKRNGPTDSTIATKNVAQSSAAMMKLNLRPKEKIPGHVKSLILVPVGRPVQIECQECANLINLCDQGGSEMNIDFVAVSAALSCRLISASYQGPVLRLRRSDNNAEQDFYADREGNLTTLCHGEGESVEEWIGPGVSRAASADSKGNSFYGLGPSAGSGSTKLSSNKGVNHASNPTALHVVVWYSQNGVATLNAAQDEHELQPLYNPNKRLVHFVHGTFLNLHACVLGQHNSAYTWILKHGAVRNPRGGFFGCGFEGTNEAINFRREPVGNQYLEYWNTNDMYFGSFEVGNVVTCTYDGRSKRMTYLNNRLCHSARPMGTRNGAMEEAFLGKTLQEDFLDGEIEYFLTFNKALTVTERFVLDGAVSFYDQYSVCPHCNVALTLDQLNDVDRVCVRFSRSSIDEIIFCYARGGNNSFQAKERRPVPGKASAVFSLTPPNGKKRERIACINFQQSAYRGLMNIRFVTNTGRSSPVIGKKFVNADYLTYTFTAPASSGGIIGVKYELRGYVTLITGVMLRNGRTIEIIFKDPPACFGYCCPKGAEEIRDMDTTSKKPGAIMDPMAVPSPQKMMRGSDYNALKSGDHDINQQKQRQLQQQMTAPTTPDHSIDAKMANWEVERLRHRLERMNEMEKYRMQRTISSRRSKFLEVSAEEEQEEIRRRWEKENDEYIKESAERQHLEEELEVLEKIEQEHSKDIPRLSSRSSDNAKVPIGGSGKNRWIVDGARELDEQAAHVERVTSRDSYKHYDIVMDVGQTHASLDPADFAHIEEGGYDYGYNVFMQNPLKTEPSAKDFTY